MKTFLFKLFIFAALGCGTLLLFAQDGGARTLRFQSNTEREYAGTINNNLRVRIRLRREGDALRGSYAYERVGKSLRLEGKVYETGEFTLDEFDEHNKSTGNFSGRFVTKDWIEGYWSSGAAESKELPFSAMVEDGTQIPAASAGDAVSGRYRRIFRGSYELDPATLNVWLLKDGRYRISGDALWLGPGDEEHRSVHVGNIEGVYKLEGRSILYKDTSDENGCSVKITFGANSATITDDNGMCGGVNVTFDGQYKKVGPPHQ